MRLGVDATWLPRDRRGMGRFVLNILRRFLDPVDEMEVSLLSRDAADRKALEDLLGPTKEPWLFVPWSAAESAPLDVCWFPWNRVDVEPDCVRIVTIHDTAAFDWPLPGWTSWLDNRRAQGRLRAAVTRSHRVMTVSRFSRERICHHLGVRPEAVDIVSEGPSFSFHPELCGRPPAPFVLYVGALDRRKNLEGLLVAWERLQEDPAAPLGNRELLVAGVTEAEGRGLHPRLRRVRFETDVDDDRLLRLYHTCDLFVMPSHYEGFGLPLLEAMACGAPTAAARAASLPEVGGEAPEWFDPHDAGDMARALRTVLADDARAATMRQLGLEQARTFTWERAAREVLSSLRRTRLDRLDPH